MATLQDILSGNFPAAQRYAEGYAQMPSYLQDPYLGLSTSQVGNVTKGLLSKTQFEKAQEVASKNAETLLGLPKGNTAMDRAKAMGYDIENPVYHGTSESYSKIDPSKLGNVTKSLSAKKAFWAVDNPKTAEGYANYGAMDAKVNDLITKSQVTEVGATHPIFPISATEKAKRLKLANDLMNQAQTLEQEFIKNPNQGQNIMPLLVSKNKQSILDAGGNKFMDFQDEMHNVINDAIANQYKSVKIPNLSDEIDFSNYNPATHYGIIDPSAVRSRFAAFDPARANEPNLLAATMAIPVSGLLEQPKDKKKKK